MDDQELIQLQNDELTPDEENAIAAVCMILTDIQLLALMHISAQILANRQGVTEHKFFNVEVNRPEEDAQGEPSLIVMPGGKI